MLHLILRIHAECAADEASTRVVQRRLLEALAPWNATPRFAPEHSERFRGRCNLSFDLPHVPGAFAELTAIAGADWDHSGNDTNDDGGTMRSSVWKRSDDEPSILLLPEVVWAELLDYDTAWERFNWQYELSAAWNRIQLKWPICELTVLADRALRALKSYRST